MVNDEVKFWNNVKDVGVREVLDYIQKERVNWVDLQFTDLLGGLHHVTVNAKDVDERSLEKGFGKLDGSSAKGFSQIYDSDEVLIPIIGTFGKIPWRNSAIRFLSRVYAGFGRGRLTKDPRYTSERIEEVLKSEGFKSYVGCELEFYILDKVDVDVLTPYAGSSYRIHSRESPWSYGSGYFTKLREGYYVVEPTDRTLDVREEASDILNTYFGIHVEAHHHETASSGQAEIDFKYSTPSDAADKVQTIKYVVKNVAAKHGVVATFMPKPIYGEAGSGLHTHLSLWNGGGVNVFYDPNDNYAELSQIGRYFIGGLLEHSRALAAIVSPTTNSYKRLVPGYEAPIYLVWSKSNRSAAVRVPLYYKGDNDGKRVEYRIPDPSSNPYLTISASLAAGLDGIKRKIDPGDPVDEDVYHMTAERKRSLGVRELPRTLWEALDELESDNEFLRYAFPKELIETYVELKRSECVKSYSYPTPIEFYMYFDS
ncbi:MAG: type I glutamate--ammonia ligase [Sulfolobales archaeon]|nr:type I glutamate--ammonia ligase [Sulfolobales archaeon]